MLGIDIDGPDPDRHALETNPDLDPAKLWGSDPIRIWKYWIEYVKI